MGRDYRIVDATPKGWKFRRKSPEFHCNVWCCEYYGRIFKHLGFATEKPLKYLGVELAEFPRIAHEYKSEDLAQVNVLSKLSDFRQKLIDAITKANKEMEYDAQAPEEVAEEMLAEVFPLFQDPNAVAVASDYCEEYA